MTALANRTLFVVKEIRQLVIFNVVEQCVNNFTMVPNRGLKMRFRLQRSVTEPADLIVNADRDFFQPVVTGNNHNLMVKALTYRNPIVSSQ